MTQTMDLRQVPFSRRGSYLAVSRVADRDGVPGGVYLRTVHGGAVHGELFRLEVVVGGDVVPFTESVAPERLELRAGAGTVELCLATSRRLLVRGTGAGLRLTAVPASPYDSVVRTAAARWQYLSYAANLNLVLTSWSGGLDVASTWSGLRHDDVVVTAVPDAGTGTFLLAVDEHERSVGGVDGPVDFDAAVAAVAADAAAWLDRAPVVPPDLAETRRLAAYVNWSSVVDERGLVRRPSMLMSKNHMTNVWSWDHCFNAMALTGDVDGACAQFLTMFDHQDDAGALPDSFNDVSATYTFLKPPVHGWALGWMMDRADLPETFLRQAYAALSRWTEWWFTHRDDGGDGFPAYHHGNDSGWDNSTAFGRVLPLESPDLQAFLVLGMEVLADLAERFGEAGAGAAWRGRAQRHLSRTLDTFWTGDRFVARHALTRERVDCDSLLMSVPLVLGDRLPPDVVAALADGLGDRGFLTEHGLATESVTSPHYRSDGYWRGPIWAPSTLLVVDGLARSGRRDLAAAVARRFCAMVSASGMAENFDAVTGAGLRDRAYTWTSSVFLILAAEYL